MKKRLVRITTLLLLTAIFMLCTAGAPADGNYAVDVVLSGGSGKVSVDSPARLIVEDGEYFAEITWSSPDYDYIVIDGETYDNLSEAGENAMFRIPVPAFDEKIPVIADTTVLGEPHEIPYMLLFYADSIGPESTLPQEGAKRVLLMAAAIIIAGGVLNRYANQKRKKDYSGEKR